MTWQKSEARFSGPGAELESVPGTGNRVKLDSVAGDDPESAAFQNFPAGMAQKTTVSSSCYFQHMKDVSRGAGLSESPQSAFCRDFHCKDFHFIFYLI